MAPEAPVSTAPDSPAPDLFARLSAVLDEVGAVASSGALCGDEVVALSGQLSRLESAVGIASSSFCAAGGHREEGARSGAVWLSLRGRLSRRRASSLLRCGSVASSLPRFAAAWASGELSCDHLSALSAHLSCPRTRERLLADEELLCGLASSLSFAEFTRAVAYWAHHADPEGSTEAAEARRSRRDVSLVPSFGGTFFGRMVLDPVSGEIVARELDRLEAELFRDDVSEALERLGRDPETSELCRSAAQRRADALCLMAARSALVGDTPIEARPLLTVLVDAPTLFGRICETASGVVLDPSDLDGLLTRALVERAVFSAPSRVEISRRSRLFRGATRRAVEIRDRSCRHPLCEEPASRCQVDHVVPYAEGGETTQENGRLLCGFHNRLRLTTEGVPGRRGPPGGPSG
jgi:5-methylcytosine-specific restriction endonuclease McrA